MAQLQMVEVAPGRLKSLGRCTKADRLRADRIIGQKMTLMERHGELIEQLDDANVELDLDGGTLPLTSVALATGEMPEVVLLPALRREVDELERIASEIETA
jgi:hypothetical protein